MTTNQIELKLEHEVLSRYSKASSTTLDCSLGNTSSLTKNLINTYLSNEPNWNNKHVIDEVILDQFAQTHQLILKLAGVAKIEVESKKITTPFNLFMTLDRENLCFHSYALLFGEKSFFETPQRNVSSSWNQKFQWEYNWMRNFR
tara:strand:- start:9803 stop:10237 length:435 start_codon:yes stop_codon:yes gene_type:complete